MDAQKLQVLRTIDKADKIGINGVIDLLQKPTAEFGADVDPIRAAFLGMFLKTGELDGGRRTLAAMENLLDRAPVVRDRLVLMEVLEETIIDRENDRTLWDELLAMAPNRDMSWRNGGRPENIAWALDDIATLIAALNEGRGASTATDGCP